MREIFVFGSNLAGRHGAGAALHAKQYHGAVYGQGQGLYGNSYAIPTKDRYIHTLPLPHIEKYVKRFLTFAVACNLQNRDLIFNVTPIGCGLAGHDPKDIAPMFKMALDLPNVRLPEQFLQVLMPQTYNKIAMSKKVEIKQLLNKKVPQREIAKLLGISQGSVCRIKKEFDKEAVKDE